MSQNQIKNGVGVLIIQNNKVLLAQRKGAHAEGEYGSLGGHLEYGETPIEAAIREAKEEFGIELDNFRFLMCLNMLKYDRHAVNLTFLADIKEGIPKIMEADKFISLDWFEVEKPPAPLFTPTEIALKAFKTGEKYFEIDYTKNNPQAHSLIT